MADCSQSPHEFFQDAFSPQVAVLCSHDAELLCRKNNLSFVELTQPFCRLSAEGMFNYKDSKFWAVFYNFSCQLETYIAIRFEIEQSWTHEYVRRVYAQ